MNTSLSSGYNWKLTELSYLLCDFPSIWVCNWLWGCWGGLRVCTTNYTFYYKSKNGRFRVERLPTSQVDGCITTRQSASSLAGRVILLPVRSKWKSQNRWQSGGYDFQVLVHEGVGLSVSTVKVRQTCQLVCFSRISYGN